MSIVLLNPVPKYGKRNVTQGFGENPEVYQKLAGRPGHGGIDIGVPVGTPVRSASPDEGHVITARTSKPEEGLGNYVQVAYPPCEDYPQGYELLYGHLSQVNTVANAKVSPGQHLALSGDTGNSTGPHLHFGFRDCALRDNAFQGYQDPAPFISWDSDGDVQTYVSRYNPYRQSQGLEELPSVGTDKYSGKPSDYGVLSDSQAAKDRVATGMPQAKRTVKDHVKEKAPKAGKYLGSVGVKAAGWAAGIEGVLRSLQIMFPDSNIGNLVTIIPAVLTLGANLIDATPQDATGVLPTPTPVVVQAPAQAVPAMPVANCIPPAGSPQPQAVGAPYDAWVLAGWHIHTPDPNGGPCVLTITPQNGYYRIQATDNPNWYIVFDKYQSGTLAFVNVGAISTQ